MSNPNTPSTSTSTSRLPLTEKAQDDSGTKQSIISGAMNLAADVRAIVREFFAFTETEAARDAGETKAALTLFHDRMESVEQAGEEQKIMLGTRQNLIDVLDPPFNDLIAKLYELYEAFRAALFSALQSGDLENAKVEMRKLREVNADFLEFGVRQQGKWHRASVAAE